jgi:hypothetical protein
MVDQRPFLFKTLTWVDKNTFPFQEHLKATCDLLPPLAHVCFLPFEQLIEQQMVQLQDSILEHLHRYTLFSMLFDMTSETHCAQILSCSGPGVGVWLIIRPVSLTVRLYSLVFCITFHKWLGPSLNCMHPSMCVHISHQPYGYPPVTLCSWQQTH